MNERIAMLRDSMRCLVCGALGLIPVLGLPAAIAALWYYLRARPATEQDLRLVGPYLSGGLGLACAGLAVTSLCFVAAMIMILHQMHKSPLMPW